MSNKPMISAFLEVYQNYKPNTSDASDVFNQEFIENYIKHHINTEDKMKQIIIEYGFKKLIDEMVELHGEEVCEDILEPMKVESMWNSWLYNMLSNLAYDE